MLIDKSIGAVCTISEYLSQMQRVSLQLINKRFYKSYILYSNRFINVCEIHLVFDFRLFDVHKKELEIFVGKRINTLTIIGCNLNEITENISIDLIAKIRVKEFYFLSFDTNLSYLSKLLKKSKFIRKVFIGYDFMEHTQQINNVTDCLLETNIKELYLSPIFNQKAKHLKLFSNINTKILTLRYFNIKDKQVEQLLKTMKKSNLKKIDLLTCSISEIATEKLINGCKEYKQKNIIIPCYNIKQLLEIIPVAHTHKLYDKELKFTLDEETMKKILYCLSNTQNKITTISLTQEVSYATMKCLINNMPFLSRVNEYKLNLESFQNSKVLKLFDLLLNKLNCTKKVKILFNEGEKELYFKYLELLPKLNTSKISLVLDYGDIFLRKLIKALQFIKQIRLSIRNRENTDQNYNILFDALHLLNIKKLTMCSKVNLQYFSEILPQCTIDTLTFKDIEYTKEEVVNLVNALNKSTVKRFNGFTNFSFVEQTISPSIKYNERCLENLHKSILFKI